MRETNSIFTQGIAKITKYGVINEFSKLEITPLVSYKVSSFSNDCFSYVLQHFGIVFSQANLILFFHF